MLDPSVRKPVADRCFDPGALLGDRAGEPGERLKARSPGLSEPCVEQRDRVLERYAVDLPELLGEQVGAVRSLVELLDAGELELSAPRASRQIVETELDMALEGIEFTPWQKPATYRLSWTLTEDRLVDQIRKLEAIGRVRKTPGFPPPRHFPVHREKNQD